MTLEVRIVYGANVVLPKFYRVVTFLKLDDVIYLKFTTFNKIDFFKK